MKNAYLSKNINKKEYVAFGILLLIILIVTGFPYLKGGISGYEPDLMYHLLRIESVKESLLQGEYPVRIYNMFFSEYGYGSPLFYPDVFLILPAMLRIIGLSPIITWKVFALIITAIATGTTYYAYRYICEKWQWALCGTTLLMLSQFYLADLQNRIGLSEYIAYIFIPLLVVGIYDFFAKDGEKVYFMGIAFLGLVLSHTIMTFIGVIITVVIFVVMLFVPQQRNYIICKDKMKRLIITAVATILSAAFYLLPMLEQMATTTFKYAEPWATVSEYTQPLSVFFNATGYFDSIAYVGIGIPIILLIGARFFWKKPQNIWINIFFYGGILLFIITTDFIPWNLLSHTMLNMIQFTYRFYPYALIFLIAGIILHLSEQYEQIIPQKIVLLILSTSILFGVWQNYTIVQRNDNIGVTEEDLINNANFVGKGEWLPTKVGETVAEVSAFTSANQFVVCNSEYIKFDRIYNGGVFEIKTKDELDYMIPLIYYKGYVAQLEDCDGTKVQLEVTESENGLVKVKNTADIDGIVTVKYVATPVQNISLCISCCTLIVVMFCSIKRSLFIWSKEKKEI